MTHRWASRILAILSCITISLLPTLSCQADIITCPNTFVAGQTLPAASLNANFAAIYGAFNGNITDANIASGAAISSSKISYTANAFAKGASDGIPLWSAGETGDTIPRISLMSDGSLMMGPGGVTAMDAGIVREGAAIIGLYASGTLPTLDINSGTLSNVGNLIPLAGAGSADQVLGYNHTGTGIEYKTITAGSNISVTGAANSITISSSSAVSSVSNSDGTITVSPTTGDVVASLPTTAVAAGSYSNPSLTVDAYGRITAAVSGGSGLQTAHINISSSQIQHLRASPVTVVSGIPSKQIVPVAWTVYYNYYLGFSPYVGSPDIALEYMFSGSPSVEKNFTPTLPNSLITQASGFSCMQAITGFTTQYYPPGTWTGLDLILTNTTSSEFTGNGGDMDFYVTYYVIP